jgi:hypothetical protein
VHAGAVVAGAVVEVVVDEVVVWAKVAVTPAVPNARAIRATRGRDEMLFIY